MSASRRGNYIAPTAMLNVLKGQEMRLTVVHAEIQSVRRPSIVASWLPSSFTLTDERANVHQLTFDVVVGHRAVACSC
jgi:hypothetical protein